jgi:hypothetical protein
MRRRRPPSERDDQQLYGYETRLIDTHGPRNPGPDPGRFPVPADEAVRGHRARGPAEAGADGAASPSPNAREGP